jgi:hypothetical protein
LAKIIKALSKAGLKIVNQKGRHYFFPAIKEFRDRILNALGNSIIRAKVTKSRF